MDKELLIPGASMINKYMVKKGLKHMLVHVGDYDIIIDKKRDN